MPPLARATPRPAVRRLALLALLLGGGAAARAQVPNVPPAADPRLYAPPSTNQGATAFACSVETLVSSAECILESAAAAAADAKAQARDNQALAASLSGWACAFAARAPGEPAPDREVLARCEKAFKERALSCGADGARPLLDGRGLFAPEARSCYAGLSEVLAQTRTMAFTSAPCCRCLAAAGCPDAGRCNRDLTSGPLPARLAACLKERCGEACRSFRADPPPAGEPAKPGPPPPWNPFHPEHECDRH